MSNKTDRPLDDRDSLLLGWVEDELTPEQAARFEAMCKTDASLARLANEMKADRGLLCRMPGAAAPEGLWQRALAASEGADIEAAAELFDEQTPDTDEVLRFPGRSSMGVRQLLRGALAASLLIVGSVAVLQLGEQKPGGSADTMMAMQDEPDPGDFAWRHGEMAPSEAESAQERAGLAARTMRSDARGRMDEGLENFADQALADSGLPGGDLPTPSRPMMPLPGADALPSPPPEAEAMAPSPATVPPGRPGGGWGEEPRMADSERVAEPGLAAGGVGAAEPGVASAASAADADHLTEAWELHAELDDDPVVAALMANLSMIRPEPADMRAAGLEGPGRVVVVVESPDVGRTVQDMSRWAVLNNVEIHAQRQVDPLELETARNRLEQVVIQRSAENIDGRAGAGRVDMASRAPRGEVESERVMRGQSRVVDREEVAEVRRDLFEAMQRNQLAGGRAGQFRAHPITVEIEPERISELFAQIPRDQAMTVMIEGTAIPRAESAARMSAERPAEPAATTEQEPAGESPSPPSRRPAPALARAEADVAERADGQAEDAQRTRPDVREASRARALGMAEGLPQSTVVEDDRGVIGSLRMNSQMWQSVLNRAVLNQQMRVVPQAPSAALDEAQADRLPQFERQRPAPRVVGERSMPSDAARNVVIEILVVPSEEIDLILQQRGR